MKINGIIKQVITQKIAIDGYMYTRQSFGDLINWMDIRGELMIDYSDFEEAYQDYIERESMSKESK